MYNVYMYTLTCTMYNVTCTMYTCTYVHFNWKFLEDIIWISDLKYVFEGRKLRIEYNNTMFSQNLTKKFNAYQIPSNTSSSQISSNNFSSCDDIYSACITTCSIQNKD